MAPTTAPRHSLANLVICKLTADAWASFLSVLEVTGDTRFAAGMAPALMRARLLLWMEEELEDLVREPEVHVDQIVR